MMQRYPVLMTAACCLVFVAAFLPWGEFHNAPELNLSPELLNRVQQRFLVDGWTGTISIGPVRLPHWLTVISAVVTGAFIWLDATGESDVSPVYPLMPVLYGCAHSWYALGSLIVSNRITPGTGCILATCTFSVMLILVIPED